MLKIEANQYEFDSPGSEQSLVIAAAGSREFADLDSFVNALPSCSVRSLRHIAAIPCSSFGNPTPIINLQRFLGKRPPENSSVHTIIDEWNDTELVFSFKSTYLWYRWQTSA